MCRAVWLVFHDSLSDRLIKKQMFQFRARSDDGCPRGKGENTCQMAAQQAELPGSGNRGSEATNPLNFEACYW